MWLSFSFLPLKESLAGSRGARFAGFLCCRSGRLQEDVQPKHGMGGVETEVCQKNIKHHKGLSLLTAILVFIFISKE